MFSGINGSEYKSKVLSLGPDKSERFLYQEYVRSRHASRVRAWIAGTSDDALADTKAQRLEIDKILSGLDSVFRRDLAIVCESHNLSDISDRSKYQISYPYGNSDAETANVQYAAIILRTVDLLQVTHSRAPSVLYRLIDPTDPISQVEWAKQNAVRRIRAKHSQDRDGNVVQSNTIEVFALFTNPDGYFGLTTYLRYADEELRRSYALADKSKTEFHHSYEFPWRNIDQTNITTEGFQKQKLSFQIDQGKILDLLTGHTLYNDSAVVVRELTQNAIDATRLQCAISHKNPQTEGLVRIQWDPVAAVLNIIDNGTGMSEAIIQNHLLKVGSSRYRDPDFQKEHPKFSAISRFGIGVLSSFMVADDVDIWTTPADENKSRHISFRTVHGQYLLRILEKTDPELGFTGSGTRVRLKLRSAVHGLLVEQTLKAFIMFPGVKVILEVAGASPQVIGYASPVEALKAFTDINFSEERRDNIKFEIIEKDGFSVAFALERDRLFGDWSFLHAPEQRGRGQMIPICTCIEGIAVEFTTPGFDGRSILAVANATGKDAPQTDVARVNITRSSAKASLRRMVLDAYIAHVNAEVERISGIDGYSVSWSISQISVYIAPLLSRAGPRHVEDIEEQVINNIRGIIVEPSNADRAVMTAKEVAESSTFWTVDAELMRSVERLSQQAESELRTRDLFEMAQRKSGSPLPAGPIVSGLSPYNSYGAIVLKQFQPFRFIGYEAERRLDVEWQSITESNRSWKNTGDIRNNLAENGSRLLEIVSRTVQEFRNGRENGAGYIPQKPIEVVGLENYHWAKLKGSIWFLPHSPLVSFFDKLVEEGTEVASLQLLVFVDSLALLERIRLEDQADQLQRTIARVASHLPDKTLNEADEFLRIFGSGKIYQGGFDSMKWINRLGDLN